MNVSSYLHILDGRLRIKVPEVKGSPLKASGVEQALRRMDGITHAKANPTTGNVLVLFEPTTISQERILEALKELGCLQSGPGSTHRMRNVLTEFLLQSAVEMALERVILALI